jgi:hypothetical protein
LCNTGGPTHGSALLNIHVWRWVPTIRLVTHTFKGEPGNLIRCHYPNQQNHFGLERQLGFFQGFHQISVSVVQFALLQTAPRRQGLYPAISA